MEDLEACVEVVLELKALGCWCEKERETLRRFKIGIWIGNKSKRDGVESSTLS